MQGVVTPNMLAAISGRSGKISDLGFGISELQIRNVFRSKSDIRNPKSEIASTRLRLAAKHAAL
jgi:hypothetical protein